ncbi:T6SS phospholipase effector Tle1-like catalytic domain-containing protein [Enterobacter sp. PTB]|uniref:T6SS phospholipase effector Tle1-like catalytic domain-containing protein n=1 Tax=Enterobacter sp. PTB TaxID=3143437 RepID=UPI003DA7BCD8
MSQVIPGLPCWAPPVFPEGGRLPLTAEQVNANYKKQIREADAYKILLGEQSGRRVAFTCSQSLHISLFFDGTGNNEKNDTSASPAHPTNIAKLFHATYQNAEDKGHFRYYLPGVGTPFPEINEFDYTTDGLAFAAGGEDRINWALLRLVDALMYAITPTHSRLSDDKARSLLPDMRAHWPITGEVNRRNAINNLLAPLKSQVQNARPHLLNIKLFVYGFSRGAAEARTFVNWLTELFEKPKPGEQQDMTLLGLPVSVEFLGIMDTVPSVGIAHIAPGATGHMGWAAGTQQLPDEGRFPGLIKCCRHFVAAHEQRLCFPLDSIRRPDGDYPPNTVEVVYPGMHSDVGGGYPPGDQGKSRNGVGELLSQIVLHDMYLAAFDAGAPLTVLPDLITPLIKSLQPSRAMSRASVVEFDVDSTLVQRFNLWRKTLLGSGSGPDANEDASNAGYQPYQMPHVLESALISQMAWITAWRIGRYAHHSLLTQSFFTSATHPSAQELETQKKDYDIKQQARFDARKKIDKHAPNWQSAVTRGLPQYDPDNAQYQLREAAREFAEDYNNWSRDINGSTGERIKQFLLDDTLKYPVYLLSGDDEKAEYQQMKTQGDALYRQMFTDSLGTGTHTMPGSGLLAFYDEQVHDSRAWFMQSTLGGRELWAGYFRYRMIYFGDLANKQVQLISVEGKVLGAESPPAKAEYIVSSREENGRIVDVHKVRDLSTGRVEILSPEAMSAPGTSPGRVAAQQSKQIATDRHKAMLEAVDQHLTQSGARLL